MDKGLLPRRYAKALYAFAAEKGQTERVYGLMVRLARIFDADSELTKVVANPFVSDSDKIALLETAAESKDEVFDGFLRLLAKNKRLDIVRDTTLAYAHIYRQENRIHPVEVTSAAPLNEADRKRITDLVEKHIGDAKAEFTFQTDPQLIGGFVVQLDNEKLDASVSNELNRLRQSLIK